MRRVLIFFFGSFLLFAAGILSTSCGGSLPAKGTAEYESAISSFYVGLAALQAGDDQRASKELTLTTEVAAGEPAAWNNLGVLQLRQRDFENAGIAFEKAISIVPDKPRLFLNKAILAQQSGDADTAVENLQTVLKLDPKNLKASYSLALEFEKQKKTKKHWVNLNNSSKQRRITSPYSSNRQG